MRGILMGGGILISATFAGAAHAEMPTDRPFSMRGVELGITIDEFRAAQIPNDEDRYDRLQSWCSNDTLPNTIRIEGSSEDQRDGIVECQWFSADLLVSSRVLWAHWVKIGSGSGIPLFRFIESDGVLRLFQITFYANNEYHPAILDALSRGYGAPHDAVEPFQTLSGSRFTSATSVWDNGHSSITLIQRCRHLERYCLTYEHSDLVEMYRERLELRAAEAATKL